MGRARATVRIVVVDDHPLVREALASTIADQAGLEVCGSAASIVEALQVIDRERPDLALVDISLKDGSGIDLIRRVRAAHPRVRVLVLSMYDESTYGERALRAGAAGYVSKQEPQPTIIEAINTIFEGGFFFSPSFMERLLSRAAGRRQTDDEVADLTNRELEVFQLLGNGLSTREVAERLNRSVHTIETHREKIKRKLNIRSSPELTRRAVQWTLDNR